MGQRSLMLGVGAVLMAGTALAQDVPVVLNPLRADEGCMFDWIFFAIMIPFPAFFYLDMVRNRRSRSL